jgi:hypothetical protein
MARNDCPDGIIFLLILKYERLKFKPLLVYALQQGFDLADINSANPMLVRKIAQAGRRFTIL